MFVCIHGGSKRELRVTNLSHCRSFDHRTLFVKNALAFKNALVTSNTGFHSKWSLAKLTFMNRMTEGS
jgi:hypothetical protein